VEGYEHLTEELYNEWEGQIIGLCSVMKDLASSEALVLRMDLKVRLFEDWMEEPPFDREMEEPQYYPVYTAFDAIDIKDNERFSFEVELNRIMNYGFADDWFDSMRGLYILLEAIIAKFNDEISFEFEDFEKIMSAAIDKLEGLDFQVAGSIYIKSKQLPELTKLKSVAGYLDRHQLDLDIFTQRNCTEGNMSEAEKYICNELIEKPGNRNLEAIVDEIRTQF